MVTSRGAIALDPATGRPVSFVRIIQPAGEPGPLWSMIARGELWVLTRNGTLDRYDLDSGRRTASDQCPAGAAVVVPTDEGLLYGLGGSELALFRDGAEVWRRQLGTAIRPPFVQGGTVWVHASDTEGGRDRLVELDLRSGQVRSSTGLPQFGISGFTPGRRRLLARRAQRAHDGRPALGADVRDLDLVAQDRQRHEMRAVAGAEPAHRVADVGLDRRRGDGEPLADLAAGRAARHERHDLALALAERLPVASVARRG